MNDIVIRPITTQQTYHLRKTTMAQANPLKPGDDDPSTLHVGAFVGDTLIGIASIYAETYAAEPNKVGYRLRGMAVEPTYQRRGIGRKLVEATLKHIRQQNGQIYWCNARVSAQSFYESLGLITEGEIFNPEDPHIVMWRNV